MRLPRDAAATKADWDGYSGRETTEIAIKAAESLTQWMPRADGGMILEGILGDSGVTIEIDAKGDIEGVYWNREAHAEREARRWK